jgi:aryl sulfotransferase
MRYTSPDEDSGRWDGFPFRDGDIVISTRSKSGTTWMQMICALLIFRTPDLPAPLSHLSPWLDWLIQPRDEVIARLEVQQHRRFIKTHTPLDGIPLDDRATYIVVARHPLDMAVSLYHQSANLNRSRMAELINSTESGPEAAQTTPGPRTAAPTPSPATAAPTPSPATAAPTTPSPATERTTAGPARPTDTRPSVVEALRRWIDRDIAPAESLDSLPGVMWHLSDAWHRRQRPNILLVHYADLAADLAGEMRRLAERLELEPPTDDLVRAAGFAEMRARANDLAPDPAGILVDRDAFFRRGSSGAGRELLTDAEYAHYEQRVATMAPPDLLHWLHR